MSPEVYGNNGEYSYPTNDHKLNSASALNQVRSRDADLDALI